MCGDASEANFNLMRYHRRGQRRGHASSLFQSVVTQGRSCRPLQRPRSNTRSSGWQLHILDPFGPVSELRNAECTQYPTKFRCTKCAKVHVRSECALVQHKIAHLARALRPMHGWRAGLKRFCVIRSDSPVTLLHGLPRRRLFVETHQIAGNDTHPRQALSLRCGELVQIAHVASVAPDNLHPDDIPTSDAHKLEFPVQHVTRLH